MLTALVLSQAHAVDAEILLVGNSYTARHELDELLADTLERTVPGLFEVRTTAVTEGGQTLAGHLAAAQQPGTPLERALVSDRRPWKLVILQEQSQTPALPRDDPAWESSLAAAVALDDLVQAAGADTLFFVTWGRERNLEPMQDALTAGYLAYVEASGTTERPVYAAPVGEAFRVVAEDATSALELLYEPDGSHPSPAGSVLAAATMVAAWTGRRPELPDVVGTEGVPPWLGDLLVDAADAVTRRAIDGPFPWRWFHDWADWPAGAPIDGNAARPTVVLGAAATQDVLEIGDGTLVLDPGAALDVDRLAIGARGELWWRGGTLRARRVTGNLALPAAGVLEVDDTVVHGTVRGVGTIRWRGSPGRRWRAVLTADRLRDDPLTVDVGGADWELRDDALWVRQAGSGCQVPADSPQSGALAAWALLALALAGWSRRSGVGRAGPGRPAVIGAPVTNAATRTPDRNAASVDWPSSVLSPTR